LQPLTELKRLQLAFDQRANANALTRHENFLLRVLLRLRTPFDFCKYTAVLN